VRCTWMVFFGSPSGAHAHEAGTAMKVALIPLALGVLVTWLLAGPFRELFVRTLPLHVTAAESGAVGGMAGTWSMAAKVLLEPATWLAVLVVVIGAALWTVRSTFAGISRRFGWLRRAAEAGYGFESVNRGIVSGVQGTGEGLRVTQSGLLNWNVGAIVMAVIVVLGAVWLIGGLGG
jgi:NADH-quinone oxidoreductase subunit L